MTRGRDDEEDSDDRDEAPPLSPAVARPRKTSHTAKTRTKSDSRSNTFDVGRVAVAVGDAFSAGASQSRQSFDGLQTAYVSLLSTIATKDATIADLHSRIATMSAHNPTLALLQNNADKEKLGEIEKWRTIREVAPQLIASGGPAVVPLVGWLAKKFGYVPPIANDEGSTAGRAVLGRILNKMQDGSEHSMCMLEMLNAFVTEDCKEDFGVVMQFLYDTATAGGSDKRKTAEK